MTGDMPLNANIYYSESISVSIALPCAGRKKSANIQKKSIKGRAPDWCVRAWKQPSMNRDHTQQSDLQSAKEWYHGSCEHISKCCIYNCTQIQEVCATG